MLADHQLVNQISVVLCLFVCITDRSKWKHTDGPDRTSLDKMPKHDFKKSPGVLRFELDRGVTLEPQNPYPSLRVILAEKGTNF